MTVNISRISSRLDLLYLITREFNATPDINQALRNVLSAVVALVRASDATLLLLDDQARVEDVFMISGFKAQRNDRLIMKTIPEQSLQGWALKHKKGSIVTDVNTDDRWDESNPEPRKSGSAICVPIQIPDQLIGILTITAPQANHFDESDLAMLTIVADQAAFAIDNARLFDAEQHRRRVADTLASIAHTINSTLVLNQVLSLILEQLALVIEYDSSSILLYDDDKRMLAVQAARGFEDMEDALKVKLPFNQNSPNYQAILQKKPFVIADVDAEPNWIKSSSSQAVKSWIGAPLIARDKVVGILTVDSHQTDKYTKENVNIVAAFADQAATAVANAQAVTRLQNAEATYAALFEDSTDLIIITNYKGLVLNVNRKACQILRRPKDALIDLDIGFINNRLKDFLIKRSKRLKAWLEASIEIEVLNAYREQIPLEVKVRQIQYKGTDCVEWVGRDISIRKEIEKMRQDLVNMLVHDLRGPLGNLINAIELISIMAEPTMDNPQLKDILKMARRTGQTLSDLVDSVLDVSRLEKGKVPLQRSMTSLEKLIQAVQEQVIIQANARKMELVIHPLPEISEVWIDSSLIRRALINLVGNAIKYTPVQGRISLTTTATEDKLHFTVADNGPGISKADQVHIFNKFSRVDYSVHTPTGVGLGLAFCKLATEAHGGTISVESEGIPGKGSAFHLQIPIVKK